MKVTPIEIARLVNIDGKTKFQVSALLNIATFYVEKCAVKYSRNFIKEYDILNSGMVFQQKEIKKTNKEVKYFVKFPQPSILGNKKESYFENEMQYTLPPANMNLIEMIAKFN